MIGSGGREHALAWRLAQSPRVSRVYVAPGNAGTAREDGLFNADITDIAQLVKPAQDEGIETTVVGPEGPLPPGVVEAFPPTEGRLPGRSSGRHPGIPRTERRRRPCPGRSDR